MIPGDLVGASRWPYSASHVDGWGAPWSGVLLAQDDVRAWTGTLRFSGTPTLDEVRAHVAWCHANGLLADRVPVLWNFGTHSRVWWESIENVRPYADDVAAWESARVDLRATAAGFRYVKGGSCGFRAGEVLA